MPTFASALALAERGARVIVHGRDPQRAADTDQATFDAHIDINLRAPHLLGQALAPAMVRRGHGAIINISSGAAGTPGLGTGI